MYRLGLNDSAVNPAAERATPPKQGTVPARESLFDKGFVGTQVGGDEAPSGRPCLFVAWIRDKVEGFVWRGTLCLKGVLIIAADMTTSSMDRLAMLTLGSERETDDSTTRRSACYGEYYRCDPAKFECCPGLNCSTCDDNGYCECRAEVH
jgi:hypothetical protein